jgi:hypothetical protein
VDTFCPNLHAQPSGAISSPSDTSVQPILKLDTLELTTGPELKFM